MKLCRTAVNNLHITSPHLSDTSSDVQLFRSQTLTEPPYDERLVPYFTGHLRDLPVEVPGCQDGWSRMLPLSLPAAQRQQLATPLFLKHALFAGLLAIPHRTAPCSLLNTRKACIACAAKPTQRRREPRMVTTLAGEDRWRRQPSAAQPS